MGMVQKFLGALVLLATLACVTVSLPAQEKKKEEKKVVEKHGVLVFEIYLDKGEKYRFRMKDGDELFGGSSKGYKTKEDVERIIDVIRKDAAKAKVVDATKK